MMCFRNEKWTIALRNFCFFAYKLSFYHTVSKGGDFLKEKIKTFLSVCVLVVAIPYIVTLLFQGKDTKEGEQAMEQLIKQETPLIVELNGQQLEVEEYLAGIVALEIPLDSEPEAIKAQAVIARTELLGAVEAQGTLPDAMSLKEMLTLWGQDGFEKNYQVLEEAIKDTEGEVLLWKEKLIQPAFHAVSAGQTRKAKEALGIKQPYLKNVDSKVDISSPNYLKVVFFEKNALTEKLKQACPDAELSAETIIDQIIVSKRDSSDYVLEVQVGTAVITGEEFRNCLGLNSACCFLKEVEGQIRIVTKGLGHGLGLSQYGANQMAKEGGGYKDILTYYYSNTKVEKK